MNLIYILLIIIAFIFLYMAIFKQTKGQTEEHFNEQTGFFCSTCNDKTFNQCVRCFNCLWVTDKWNNSKCIGGDIASGPYNNEDYAYYTATDPLPTMKYMNKNYKCSYGPRQGNRVIGVNPYDDMGCDNSNYGCNRLSRPINKMVNENPWNNMVTDDSKYRCDVQQTSTNKLTNI